MRRAALLAILTLAACAGERANPALVPGEYRLPVTGGSIWYRVTGAGTGTPVVLLHGGPGVSSYYLKPLEQLADDRVVIRYDQLGSGKSDTTSDTTHFTVARFVGELDSLRSRLGIEQWHLYGHSWGSMLAAEYYRAHPDRVASLVFGSPVFDSRAFEQYVRTLLPTLSDSAQRAIRRAEASGNFAAPSYQNASSEFMARYLTLTPVQADWDSTMAGFGMAVYGYMWGPSEFTVTGTLKNFDVKDLLPRITVPVLVTVGEHDEVGPELVRSHAALVPGARFELIPGAAHLTSWDNTEVNTRVVRGFLRSADSSAAGRR